MVESVIHTDDNGVSASLIFKDKKGNMTSPSSMPVWTLTAEGVVEMTVAEDGMTASFVPLTVGEVGVDVVAEGDEVPGVDVLHATGNIKVLAGDADTVDLVFTPIA